VRLKGCKFVNSLGHPVKVLDVRKGIVHDKNTEFVFYVDARSGWNAPGYTMKLKKPMFVKRYKKSLDDFNKPC
jgi:hypothetical protein